MALTNWQERWPTVPPSMLAKFNEWDACLAELGLAERRLPLMGFLQPNGAWAARKKEWSYDGGVHFPGWSQWTSGQDPGNWYYACVMRAMIHRHWPRGDWTSWNLNQMNDEHLADVWEAILGLRHRINQREPVDSWLWHTHHTNMYDHEDAIVHYASCIERAILCFYALVGMIQTVCPDWKHSSNHVGQFLG